MSQPGMPSSDRSDPQPGCRAEILRRPLQGRYLGSQPGSETPRSGVAIGVDLDLGSSAGGKAMSNLNTKIKEKDRKAKSEAKRLRRLGRRKDKRKQQAASNS